MGMAGIIAKRQLGINWKAQAMNDNQDLKVKEFMLRPEDDKSWEKAMEYITKHEHENLGLTVTYYGKLRTITQNSCIHKYCSMLAHALNESSQYQVIEIPEFMYGKTVDAIQGENGIWYVEMPWTGSAIKIKWWHKIQRIMYPHAVNKDGEPSTAALNTVECGEVYKIISQNIAAGRGIDVPWPSRNGN